MNAAELVNILDWLAILIAPICLLALWIVLWCADDPDLHKEPDE